MSSEKLKRFKEKYSEEKKTSTKIITYEIKVPEHVDKAWNDLYPSIASAFRSSKWNTKYTMLEIFNDWYKSLSRGGK